MSNSSTPITSQTILKALQAVNPSHLPPHPMPFADLYAVQARLEENPSPTMVQTAVRSLLQQAVAILSKENSRRATLASIVTTRYLGTKGLTIEDTAAELNRSEDVVKKGTAQAAVRLAEIVAELEQEATAAHKKKLLAGMGKTHYEPRVGTADLPTQLAREVTGDGRNLIITGLGGLGKTTLAHAVIVAAISQYHYHKVATIHIDQGGLTLALFKKKLADALAIDTAQDEDKRYDAACYKLKTFAYLVLIDNVETDIAEIVDELAELTNPSHFIVTMREQPTYHGRIYVHDLQQLSVAEAGELIRATAVFQQLAALAHADEATVQKIYEVVGGHPLALILVVGLTKSISLPNALENLPRANHHNIRRMYRRIYARVWHSLNDAEKMLLQIMATTGASGAERWDIVEGVLDGLPEVGEAAVYEAIDTLVQRSLMQISGSVLNPSYWYTIHNLTKTFVQKEVLQWVEGVEDEVGLEGGTEDDDNGSD